MLTQKLADLRCCVDYFGGAGWAAGIAGISQNASQNQ